MSSPFRRFFIALSAFGYAFLGGGPSLWALGLQRPAAHQCSMAGCHCDMARHGGFCTCAISAKLLKAYPELAAAHAQDHGPAPSGGCAMRSSPLQPEEASDGANSLPLQQLHTLPSAHGLAAFERGLVLGFPAASPLSFHPEPPTPVPD